MNNTDVFKLLDNKYGTNDVAKYYLRRAKDAAGRAKVALANQNPYALGAEAQIMIENIELLANFLNDDKRLVTKDE